MWPLQAYKECYLFPLGLPLLPALPGVGIREEDGWGRRLFAGDGVDACWAATVGFRCESGGDNGGDFEPLRAVFLTSPPSAAALCVVLTVDPVTDPSPWVAALFKGDVFWAGAWVVLLADGTPLPSLLGDWRGRKCLVAEGTEPFFGLGGPALRSGVLCFVAGCLEEATGDLWWAGLASAERGGVGSFKVRSGVFDARALSSFFALISVCVVVLKPAMASDPGEASAPLKYFFSSRLVRPEAKEGMPREQGDGRGRQLVCMQIVAGIHVYKHENRQWRLYALGCEVLAHL